MKYGRTLFGLSVLIALLATACTNTNKGSYAKPYTGPVRLDVDRASVWADVGSCEATLTPEWGGSIKVSLDAQICLDGLQWEVAKRLARRLAADAAAKGDAIEPEQAIMRTCMGNECRAIVEGNTYWTTDVPIVSAK